LAETCPLPFGEDGSPGILWREGEDAAAPAAANTANAAAPANTAAPANAAAPANTNTDTDRPADAVPPAAPCGEVEGEESDEEDMRDLLLEADTDGDQAADSDFFEENDVTEEEAAEEHNKQLIAQNDPAAVYETDADNEQKSAEDAFSVLLSVLEEDFKGYVVSQRSITEAEIGAQLIGRTVMICEDATDSWVFKHIQTQGTARCKWNFKVVEKKSRETENVLLVANTYGVDNASRWVLIEKKK
jgi:hypothetical protein